MHIINLIRYDTNTVFQLYENKKPVYLKKYEFKN